jgi:DNA-binding NtrC family response regulator
MTSIENVEGKVFDSKRGVVLVAADDAASRELLNQALWPLGFEVMMAQDGSELLELAKNHPPDLVLLDILMPGLSGPETCRILKSDASLEDVPVIFITGNDELTFLLEAYQAGGVDYITKPFRVEELHSRVKTHSQLYVLIRELKSRNEALSQALADLEREMNERKRVEAPFVSGKERLSVISQAEAEKWGIPRLIGNSKSMAKVIETVRRLQSIPKVDTLVVGESGTGKEVIARAIHFGSPRSSGPFISVNCSAIPAELAESLLFGHIKGSFTGAASNQKGYFEMADGGTLFFDELGEMPLKLQAKLLRVLETGRLMRLGDSVEFSVDVRMIAATNSDLQEGIENGEFREDLFHRLARFIIGLPPLRDRRGDILEIAQSFVHNLAEDMELGPATLGVKAADKLARYDFPGNVRELRNIIERALIESNGGTVQEQHIHFSHEILQKGSRIQCGTQFIKELSPEELAITSYIEENGSLTNPQCRALLQVSSSRAWYILRTMHRKQQIIMKNTGRWAKYYLSGHEDEDETTDERTGG